MFSITSATQDIPAGPNHPGKASNDDLGRPDSIQVTYLDPEAGGTIFGALYDHAAASRFCMPESKSVTSRSAAILLPPIATLAANAPSVVPAAQSSKSSKHIAVLLGHGYDAELLQNLQAVAAERGARVLTVAHTTEGVHDSNGCCAIIDLALSTARETLFDGLIVLSGPEGDPLLANQIATVEWLHECCATLPATSRMLAHHGADALMRRAKFARNIDVRNLDGFVSIADFISDVCLAVDLLRLRTAA